jgi:hypothetical protein
MADVIRTCSFPEKSYLESLCFYYVHNDARVPFQHSYTAVTVSITFKGNVYLLFSDVEQNSHLGAFSGRQVFLLLELPLKLEDLAARKSRACLLLAWLFTLPYTSSQPATISTQRLSRVTVIGSHTVV